MSAWRNAETLRVYRIGRATAAWDKGLIRETEDEHDSARGSGGRGAESCWGLAVEVPRGPGGVYSRASAMGGSMVSRG